MFFKGGGVRNAHTCFCDDHLVPQRGDAALEGGRRVGWPVWLSGLGGLGGLSALGGWGGLSRMGGLVKLGGAEVLLPTAQGKAAQLRLKILHAHVITVCRALNFSYASILFSFFSQEGKS